MRLLLWVVIAAASFLVGWSGTRWITQPPSRTSAAVPAATSGNVADPLTSNQQSASTADEAEDPMAALVALAEAPATPSRDHALTAAVFKLKPADFPAGAEQMLALLKRVQKPVQPEAGELAELWMDRWLELDTPGALRFLTDSSFLADLFTGTWGLNPASRATSGTGGILKALARRQPEWARQTLVGIKQQDLRDLGVYVLLREVAQGGAREAAKYRTTFENSRDRSAAMTGYVTGLARADLTSGFDTALSEAPGPFREQLLTLVFNQAGTRGVSVTRELLERIEDPAARRRHAATALSAIGFAGLEDALPFIQAESERMAANGDWNSNVSDWASSVEVAARGPRVDEYADWAVGFAPDVSRKMFAQIASTWVGRHPETLQKWLTERAGTLDAVAVEKLGQPLSRLASSDLAGTRAWAETLPPGPLRAQARFQLALSAGAAGDLTQAEAAYASVVESDSEGTLASQLARVLARRDGAAAAQWAMRQPPSEARTAALRTVAETFSERDPAGAALWLQSVPPGDERDRAIGTYAPIAVRADPEGAAQWVDQVSEPALRTTTAIQVYFWWSLENPVAARAWLRTAPGLDQAVLAKYLRNQQ